MSRRKRTWVDWLLSADLEVLTQVERDMRREIEAKLAAKDRRIAKLKTEVDQLNELADYYRNQLSVVLPPPGRVQ